MTKIIDPRWPEHNRNVHSDGMKILMGLHPCKKWPLEGMPPRIIQGVKVWVKPIGPDPKQGWRRNTHRVMAQCPLCGFECSAGRLFQHKC